jgi:hypothetical protein
MLRLVVIASFWLVAIVVAASSLHRIVLWIVL